MDYNKRDLHGHWYRWNKRPITDDLLPLDILQFIRATDLTVGCTGVWTWAGSHHSSISYAVRPGEGVQLMYSHGATEQLDYLVHVVATMPYFGGQRFWWVCPVCNRRCKILYSGRLFVCRRCSGSYYATQRSKDLILRIDHELHKIHIRLQSADESVLSAPERPKGMHLDTYIRLFERYWTLQHLRIRALGADLPQLASRIRGHGLRPLVGKM